MSAFDPAAWMREFGAVGGKLAFPDGHLTTSYPIWRVPRANVAEACRLVTELVDQPSRRDALIDYVGGGQR
jgi:hypothetical protein